MSSLHYSKQNSDCDFNVDFENHSRSLSDLDSSPSVREFLEQERHCFEEDTDDFNIEHIFEQINKLQCGVTRVNEESSCHVNKNIEEILFEAGKLIELNSDKYVTRSKNFEKIKKTSFKKHSSSSNASVTSNSKTVLKKECLQSQKWEETIDCNEKHIDIVDKNSAFSSLDEKDKTTMDSQKSSNNTKDPTIYDLKQSLNKITTEKGDLQCKTSPVQDESKNSKIINAIKEELKDTNERLHSVQMQHENLAETSRLMKNVNEELSRDNKFLETKLSDKEDVITKLQKELEFFRLDKSQIDLNEAKIKQEISHLKDEKKNLLLQSSKDKMTIQDLQRQCKEMEGILARRHPDSVSALIVASKHPASEHNTKTLLEKRILFLENELKELERKYQNSLTAVHDKVNAMKYNYETHISDLENQVVSLQHINSELKELGKPKVTNTTAAQTDKPVVPIAVQTLASKPSSAKNVKSQSASVQLVKEDSHLVATVRGLTAELSQKDKVIMKMTRELEDLKKTMAKIQKEKDAHSKGTTEKICNKKSISKSSTARSTKSSAENFNSNFKSNKENELKKTEHEAVNDSLKKDLNVLQSDYEKLKKKRIEDLFALQTAHEKELMSLNVKVLPLQDDVSTLNTTVELLRNQIKLMDEQMTALIMEKDHFKHRAELLNSKLNFSTECDSDRSVKSGAKSTEKDYNILKIKVAELEKRYEGRELRLKTLVDSLARLKDSQFHTPTIDSGHCTDRMSTVPRQYLPY